MSDPRLTSELPSPEAIQRRGFEAHIIFSRREIAQRRRQLQEDTDMLRHMEGELAALEAAHEHLYGHERDGAQPEPKVVPKPEPTPSPDAQGAAESDDEPADEYPVADEQNDDLSARDDAQAA